MVNIEDKHLKALIGITKSEHRAWFKEYLEIRRQEVEDTIRSLQLDSYKANGSTVLIRRREVFNEIATLKEDVNAELTVKDLASRHENFMDELIESMS